ncbi:hypothetical protein ACFX2B_015107 [Malus domestica]
MASPSDSSFPIESVPHPNPDFFSSNPNISQSYFSHNPEYWQYGSDQTPAVQLPAMANIIYIDSSSLQASCIVDGIEPCPSPFLLDRSLNPAFEHWYEKDQNLLIWFNSTFSEEVISFTVGVSSARDL